MGIGSSSCDKPAVDTPPTKTKKTANLDKAAPAKREAEPVPRAQPAEPKPQPEAAQPAGVTQENLDRFVPAELAGLKRLGGADPLSVTEGPLLAHGAYVLEDDSGPRMVNVNLMEVVDLEFERAQFVVGQGETKNGGNTVGKEIDGRLVQRKFYGSPAKSEVTVLLVDRIVVRVSVEKATSPDEGFAYLAELDLAGLEGLVR